MKFFIELKDIDCKIMIIAYQKPPFREQKKVHNNYDSFENNVLNDS